MSFARSTSLNKKEKTVEIEPFNNPIKLISDMEILIRELEKNNGSLINLYSNLCSMVLWPLFYKALFSALTFRFMGALHTMQDRDTIEGFEHALQGLKRRPNLELQSFVHLYKESYPTYGINEVSALLRMPFHLIDLPSQGGATPHKHFMYLAAHLGDSSKFKRREMHEIFHKVYLIITKYLPSHMLEHLPEYRGLNKPLDIIPEKTSCLRYAEIIHLFYITYLSNLNLAIDPHTRKRLEEQFFWLSMGMAVSFMLIAAPIFKRFIKSALYHRITDFFRFDPLFPLLPMDFKQFASPNQYPLLEINNLQVERRSLQKALDRQKKVYIHKSNYVNLILTLSFFLGCYYFFGNSAFGDIAFALTPILATLSIKGVYNLGSDKIRTYRNKNKLQHLNERLKDILSDLKYDIQFKENHLILEIIDKYQSLKISQVSCVIKLVLHHYGVKLRLHNQTTLVIDADARIPMEAKVMFEGTLHKAQVHYQLAGQLKTLFNEQKCSALFNFESNMLDKEINFDFTLLIGLKLNNHIIQQLMTINGISIDSENVMLKRDTILSSHEFEKFRQILSGIKKQAWGEEKFSQNSSSSGSIRKKLKPKMQMSPKQEKGIEIKSEVKPIKKASIYWGSGWTYPCPEIKQIENAPNRYILWTLPLAAFGGDQKAYDAFKSHSTKLALSGKGMQGIKHAPYVAANFFTGQQQVFGARIKVAGVFGMFGVVLSQEQSKEEGFILYETRAYTRVH